jgi:hypothetical protein
VPLVILVGEPTHPKPASGEPGTAVEISQALDVSLSEIQAQYFRDSDMSSEVEQVLAEEQDILWGNFRRERG